MTQRKKSVQCPRGSPKPELALKDS